MAESSAAGAAGNDAGGVQLTGGQSGQGGASASRAVMKLTMTAKEIVAAMANVNDDQIRTMVTKTTEVTVISIDITIFSIFEYQGFDPEAIIRKLVALKDHYKMTDDDLKEQIMYMIAANIYMGNMSGKALARRSQAGRDMVDDLVSKYNIKIGTTNTGLPSDVLTFPRVAGSFPVLSCRMAQVLPTSTYPGKPFNSVVVPAFMRVNSFAALCHSSLGEGVQHFLLKAIAAYSCDQSIVYEEGRRRKMKLKGKDLEIDPKEIAADQWTFLTAAASSKQPPIDVKKAALLSFNLSAYFAALKPVVDNYNNIMGETSGTLELAAFEGGVTKFISGT